MSLMVHPKFLSQFILACCLFSMVAWPLGVQADTCNKVFPISEKARIFEEARKTITCLAGCYNEAVELARKMVEKEAIDPKTAHYVIFHHPLHGKLPAEETAIFGRHIIRHNVNEEWPMHVVIVDKGRVFDVYYKDHDNLPTVSEYMETMWEKPLDPGSRRALEVINFDPRAEIRARVFPLEPVLKNPHADGTGKKIDISYYMSDRAEGYRYLSFNEFIEEYSSPADSN